MINPLLTALSLSALSFTAVSAPGSAPTFPASMTLNEIEIECSKNQAFPLVDPYCLVSSFLGMTEAEIVEEILTRWEEYLVDFMNCGPCNDPGSCLPSADFGHQGVTITFIGPPAKFKVCFDKAEVDLQCSYCED